MGDRLTTSRLLVDLPHRVSVSDAFNSLKVQDAMDWCRYSAKGHWTSSLWGGRDTAFYFALHEDAAVFTLFWGGR